MNEKTVDQNEEELKLEFIRLRACGWSFKEIATELNVSMETLLYWVKILKHELHNQKAIEIDHINNKYKLTRNHRIEIMGNVLNKIQTELDNRDYSDVPTEKLLEYLVKYTNELQRNYEPPVFTQASNGFDTSIFDGVITWTG